MILGGGRILPRTKRTIRTFASISNSKFVVVRVVCGFLKTAHKGTKSAEDWETSGLCLNNFVNFNLWSDSMGENKYSYIKDFFLKTYIEVLKERDKVKDEKEINKIIVKIIRSLCVKICDQLLIKHILSTITSDDHKSTASKMPSSDLLFFEYEKYVNVPKPKEEDIEIQEVSLRNSGFLIHTADRKGLAESFIKFDDENNKLEKNSYEIIKVKPFNIYYVVGRNDHIIFGKYFNKDATLECKKSINFSQILKDFDYNGKCFIDKNKNEINEPFFEEHVNLFLLGKLLIEIEEDYLK